MTSFWRSFNEFNPIEKLVCNQLEWHLQTAYKNINTTLVITGTDDNNISTPNSLIIVGKIPGAWLIRIKDAGHALFVQYSDEINKILHTFLSTTTPSS